MAYNNEEYAPGGVGGGVQSGCKVPADVVQERTYDQVREFGDD
jgi:hypothetical protein